MQTQPDNGELSRSGVELNVGDNFTLAEILADQLRYEHDGSETETDFIDLSLTDGGEDGAAAALGRLSFLIREVIDLAPSIDDDQLTVEYGKPFNSTDGDTLASGFTSLSGSLLQEQTGYVFTIENAPQHRSLEIESNVNFIYLHNNSVVLQDQFTYRITNEDGVYTIATVDISIEPPIAAAIDSFTPVEIPDIDTAAAGTENLQAETIEEVIEQAEQAEQQFELTSENIGATAEAISDKEQVSTVIEITLDDQNIGLSKNNFYQAPFAVKQHNVTYIEALESVAVTTASSSYLEFEFDDRTYGIVNSGGYLRGLEQLDSDFEDAAKEELSKIAISQEEIFGLTFSATAGLVAWVLRGGALLASVVAATPVWASIDPVRVFNGENRKDSSDELKICSMIKQLRASSR